jgi:aspartyl-tRNA(Asn)/glutamyl-tRNA(Gln) amidotransferase subunit C
MSVTIQDVEHVAALARLRFADEEKETLKGELNTILDYMAQLNSLDTAGVEPLAQVVALQNVVRDDVSAPGISRDEALTNAPVRTGAFFTVPKVLGHR